MPSPEKRIPKEETKQKEHFPHSKFGVLLKTWRTDLTFTQKDVARQLNISNANIKTWEIGRALPLTHAVALVEHIERTKPAHYSATKLYSQVENGTRNTEKIRERIGEIRKEREEQDWLHTISESSFLDGLRLMLLSENLTNANASKEAEINDWNMILYKKGGKKPYPSTLNKMIDASPLDNDGKAAQLLRLKRSDMSAISVDQLLACSLGDLVLYARSVRGFSQLEMREPLGRKQFIIGKMENNGVTQHNEEIPDRLIDFLGLDPEGIFAQVIRNKVEDEKTVWLHEEERQKILDSGILLAEHIDELPDYFVSDKDKAFLEVIKDDEDEEPISTSAFAFKTFREHQRVTQYAFLDDEGLSAGNVSNIESGRYKPLETTAVRMTRARGYSLHHPVTRKLVRVAALNKAA